MTKRKRTKWQTTIYKTLYHSMHERENYWKRRSVKYFGHFT